MKYELRPSITNPNLWYPERPPKNEWTKIRKQVLDRDANTCQFCGHTATKYMNIHHINITRENNINNLITCCVACHAVLHIGRNLTLGIIEIWESDISQLDIVKTTRDGIRDGLTLEQIKKNLPIKKGEYNPKSTMWANFLIIENRDKPSISLEKPLCVVFTNLKRWQIE